MNTKSVSIAILMLAFFSQCHEGESKLEVQNLKLFHADIGTEISKETAERWINKRRAHISARNEIYSVSASNLNDLLLNVDDKLGVTFHYATDLQELQHIILQPVTESLALWRNSSVLDAKSDDFVDRETGSVWSANYRELNPSGPWSHFFGINVINEINSSQAFSRMDLISAENDAGIQQLLLFVYSTETSMGRTHEQVKIYDGSTVCPPMCAE